MRLANLIETLGAAGQFRAIAASARPQFGNAAVNLLGARILPERSVRANMYEEKSVVFRGTRSAYITRYSALPKRGTTESGGFVVKTASGGHKADITAEDLDVLNEFIGANNDLAATERLLNFTTNSLVMPRMIENEIERWQAITDGVLRLRSENGLRENVWYPNPVGNRVVLTTLWTDPTADAPADFFAMVNKMKSDGVDVVDVYASTRMFTRFINNAATQKLVGGLVAVNGGTGNLNVQPNRVTAGRVNDYFNGENLPPWTIYDARYSEDEGPGGRFLRDDAIVLIGRTGNVVPVDLGESQQSLILPNAVGYYAIGKPAGRNVAERHILVTPFDNHPPRVEGEIVQEGLPVITNGNAIAVISETAFPTPAPAP